MISFEENNVESWRKRILKDYIPNPNNRMRELWLDVTYPYIFQNSVIQWLWKRVFCPTGFHLFDEVQSVDDHCLSCDACDFVVNISRDNEQLKENIEND